MSKFDDLNGGIFNESEHRKKNDIPDSAEMLGFSLFNYEANVLTKRIVLSNQGCHYIYMTPKEMKKHTYLYKNMFMCPFLQLVFNLSITTKQKVMPCVVYIYPHDHDMEIVFCSFDENDAKKVLDSIPSPTTDQPLFS